MASKFFTSLPKLRRNLLGVALLVLPLLAQSKPAPWYWWAAPIGDGKICAQTSPGRGWLQEPRPFKDAHCSIRL